MVKVLLGSSLATAVLWGGVASAQPPSGAAAAPAASGAAAAPAASAQKDPRGIKGISPFREAINAGDRAFIARDFEGALAAYRDAISKDPQNPLGHYRMGEAQIAKGDLHEADEAFVNGLRFATADASLKAKLQFALADLREREKAWDEASAKWADYETFSGEQKTGFPASGAERKRAVEAWKKLSLDAAEVKARIEKGIAAADEAVRKSSK